MLSSRVLGNLLSTSSKTSRIWWLPLRRRRWRTGLRRSTLAPTHGRSTHERRNALVLAIRIHAIDSELHPLAAFALSTRAHASRLAVLVCANMRQKLLLIFLLCLVKEQKDWNRVYTKYPIGITLLLATPWLELGVPVREVHACLRQQIGCRVAGRPALGRLHLGDRAHDLPTWQE